MSPPVETQLLSLRQQRNQLQSNIQSLRARIDLENDPIILDCQSQIVVSHFKQALQILTNIEKIDPADANRAEIENLFIETKAIILRRIGASNEQKPEELSFFNKLSIWPSSKRSLAISSIRRKLSQVPRSPQRGI